MSIRPINFSSQARPAMEGAGVHLHRVFGFWGNRTLRSIFNDG